MISTFRLNVQESTACARLKSTFGLNVHVLNQLFDWMCTFEIRILTESARFKSFTLQEIKMSVKWNTDSAFREDQMYLFWLKMIKDHKVANARGRKDKRPYSENVLILRMLV